MNKMEQKVGFFRDQNGQTQLRQARRLPTDEHLRLLVRKNLGYSLTCKQARCLYEAENDLVCLAQKERWKKYCETAKQAQENPNG